MPNCPKNMDVRRTSKILSKFIVQVALISNVSDQSVEFRNGSVCSFFFVNGCSCFATKSLPMAMG